MKLFCYFFLIEEVMNITCHEACVANKKKLKVPIVSVALLKISFDCFKPEIKYFLQLFFYEE